MGGDVGREERALAKRERVRGARVTVEGFDGLDGRAQVAALQRLLRDADGEGGVGVAILGGVQRERRGGKGEGVACTRRVRTSIGMSASSSPRRHPRGS